MSKELIKFITELLVEAVTVFVKTVVSVLPAAILCLVTFSMVYQFTYWVSPDNWGFIFCGVLWQTPAVSKMISEKISEKN